MAEGEGFEPPDLSVCGFQDRRLKPLGHPSRSSLPLIVGCGLSFVEDKSSAASPVSIGSDRYPPTRPQALVKREGFCGRLRCDGKPFHI